MSVSHAIDLAIARAERAAAREAAAPEEEDFGNDLCGRAGAHALKQTIEEYWAKRGHNVQIMLHEAGFHPAIRSARVDVRSDMIGGLPRSALPASEKDQ